ncbi:type II secretion system protein GspL [Stutzerimonas nosocomialis]|uniref:type II secretion system protein GspL n=1 Tax=Stutzerimonas nosocomialis TaxID=1056496 RepID=UPI0011090471|nr:type II secretion system protein GspL [Stutzerimonas nosocomialis]TLX57660.1 type II secretion system protein GspL [Stutzerimonas nosocomialis]
MDCLFLPADCGTRLTEETSVYWLPGTGAGAWLSLAECAAQARGPVALILPAEVCSFFAVSLPTRKARWVNQALAYAVEELLAENVDDLHLTHGDVLEDGRHRVIAINRERLAAWYEDLQALGLAIGAIHVDADLLPREGAQLLFIGERGLLGGSPEPRLAFASEHWPMLAAQCPSPRHAQGTDAQPPVEVDDYRQVEDPYRLLGDGRAEAVDLAQGDFAARTAATGIGPWKPLFGALALVLLIQLGFNVAQAWYLERQGDAYAEASRALYSELFPEDTRIVNLRAQFTDRIGQHAGPGAGFMTLLGNAAQAVEETAVTVGQLDYNEDRGDLSMQVRANDFPALEQLRQRLAEIGQSVQLGSASREGDGVTARVVIGG